SLFFYISFDILYSSSRGLQKKYVTLLGSSDNYVTTKHYFLLQVGGVMLQHLEKRANSDETRNTYAERTGEQRIIDSLANLNIGGSKISTAELLKSSSGIRGTQGMTTQYPMTI